MGPVTELPSSTVFRLWQIEHLFEYYFVHLQKVLEEQDSDIFATTQDYTEIEDNDEDDDEETEEEEEKEVGKCFIFISI